MSGKAVLTVNGTTASVPGSIVLLTALRDSLGLTGAKPVRLRSLPLTCDGVLPEPG